MERCLESNDELTLEMQNTYDEQKVSMDELIKQVSLLTDIMKGIQEDRARSRVDEEKADEESVHEPEEGEPSKKQEEVRAAESMLAEEKSQAEEESIVIPLNDETSREAPEGASHEPQEVKDEVIQRFGGPETNLFYLQTRTVHPRDVQEKRRVSEAEGENALVE